MEKLLQYSKSAVILPEGNVLKVLAKGFQKGAAAPPEVLEACIKVVTNLSEQDGGIDAFVEYEDNLLLHLLLQNFHTAEGKRNVTFLEHTLDLLHIVIECSEYGQQKCVGMIPLLLTIIQQQKTWSFTAVLESYKLLNLLLENTSQATSLLKTAKEIKLFIGSFDQTLNNAGDYELQATIMETLFRVVPLGEKENLSRKWFPSEKIRNAFLSIRNEEFETDCRRFLNMMNTHDSMKQKVFSFPVLCISLGKYQLQRPGDSRVTDFWLDFNLSSQSLSTFTNDDNADEENAEWEMICIKKDMIRDFRVNETNEKTILILKLFEPACNLAPFCPEAPENYVKIIFEKKFNIANALQKLFGQVKYVELPISSPSISSTPARENGSRVSLAISPLAVHSSSKEKEISDRTVSSSSELSNISKSHGHVEALSKDISQNVENCIFDSHEEVVPDEKPPPEKKIGNEVVCRTTVVPESQEIVKKDILNADMEETQGNTVTSNKIEEEKIAADEKPEKILEKVSKHEVKKAKKLLSSHQVLFQDSPDENYVAAPVRPPSKQQQRKARNSKKKKQIQNQKSKKQIYTSEALEAFNFPDDNQHQPKQKSKQSRKEENKTERKQAEKTDNSRRRSSRKSTKKTCYKELTSDTEDFELQNEKVSSLKKSTDTNKKLNRYVSFVSPIEQTSYYELPSDSEKENKCKDEDIHKQLSDEDEQLTEESKMAVDDDHDRLIKNKRGVIATKDSCSNNEEIKMERREKKKSMETPKQNKNIYRKILKPFERNIQFGWGKKTLPKDFCVYDFPENDGESRNSERKSEVDVSLEVVDTPWSTQKKKKQRVKRKYDIVKKEKIISKNQTSVESSQESYDNTTVCRDNLSPTPITGEEMHVDEEPVAPIKQQVKKKTSRKQRRTEKRCDVDFSLNVDENLFSDVVTTDHLTGYSDINPSQSSTAFNDGQDIPSSYSSVKSSESETNENANHRKRIQSRQFSEQKKKYQKKEKVSNEENEEDVSPSNESTNSCNDPSIYNQLNETPMCNPEKWRTDMNRVFSYLQAQEVKPKKKLWKSPVVFLNEVSKNRKEPGLQTPSTPLTRITSPFPCVQKNVETPAKMASQADDAICQNFATFCQNILKESSKFQHPSNTPTAPQLHSVSSRSPERKKQRYSLALEQERSVQEEHIEEEDTTLNMAVGDELLKKETDTQISVKYSSNESSQTSTQSDCEEHEEEGANEGPIEIENIDESDLQSVIKTFGCRVNNTFKTKKEAMDKFLSKLSSMTTKRMRSVWKDQKQLRQNTDKLLRDSCDKHFEQWEISTRRKDDQLTKIFEDLRVMITDHSEDERRRIQTLRLVHQKYFEERNKLSCEEQKVQKTFHEHLREDIQKLHHEMMAKNKSVETDTIRRSLQAMLCNL